MKHLRFPAGESIEHIAREFQRQTDCVAVVVVSDVMSPIDKPRPVLSRMREMPVVNVDHAIASIYFNNRCDQRDHVVANVADVRTVIDYETICKLHQRGWRACFGRMNRPGNVIDRK